MALRKRGKHRYGDSHADIREELVRYAALNGYPAHHFADAICSCAARSFRLALDDAAGAAVRTCPACAIEHPIGDSAECLIEASLEECACPCGGEELEIAVAVSLVLPGMPLPRVRTHRGVRGLEERIQRLARAVVAGVSRAIGRSSIR
jgi:hypothetical protein